MDPTKRMSRPAGDYMSRGSDPANVPVARAQREADRFYRNPGTAVPNNPRNSVEFELSQNDNNQIYSIPYGDGRMLNPPGTGVTFAKQPPAPGAMRIMSPQPQGMTEQLGDLRWAGQVAGAGGPLAGKPNEWVQSPGIAKEASRYPGTGQPATPPLPPSQPMAMEDLQFAQGLLPANFDLMPQSQVFGGPVDAQLPKAGRGASPGRGGMPPVMPESR